MWQHIKIPLKTPDDNLYEVVTDEESKQTINKTSNVSIESLYPTLVEQIKTLRKRLELLVRAYTIAQKEKNNLINDVNAFSRNEKQLDEKIKTLEKNTKKFKEEIESLTNHMKKLDQESKQIQQQRNQGDDQGEEHNESTSISYEPKIYTDVEERFMNEEGHASELYP